MPLVLATSRHFPRNLTIDGPYVDGVSMTHGSPRRHIWTFAASRSHVQGADRTQCPCVNRDRRIELGALPPSFVGRDYFCDVEFNGALWDATGCRHPTDHCCNNSNPWFSVSLPAPTSDDIEVRICGDQDEGIEYTRLSYLQFYVQ